MDLKDSIKAISENVFKFKEQIKTEEATKQTFILPFIKSLGYDIYNPTEVIPEYVADIGEKKGEKIDYAIMINSNPIILIECKHWADTLSLHNVQLERYFNSKTKCKFGILTNGINYKFFTELDEPNVMDRKPFLEFDITTIKELHLNELKKFHKSVFKENDIFNNARDLKFSNELKKNLNEEFSNPSKDFVKYLIKQVYKGFITENKINQFTDIIKRTLKEFINDKIDNFISNVTKEQVKENESLAKEIELVNKEKSEENLIVTSEEELLGFSYVKSILRTEIDSNRIGYKDFQNFFNIIIDNKPRKIVCKLWFNNKEKKYISFFENNKDVRYEITSLDDIYNYSSKIKEALILLESKTNEKVIDKET